MQDASDFRAELGHCNNQSLDRKFILLKCVATDTDGLQREVSLTQLLKTQT
jgi:hypothetical protein